MRCDYTDPETGATHEEIIESLQQQIERLVTVNCALKEALDESVKLQAHYAKLLNMHDGGKRISFESSEEWLNRLRAMKKKP